MIFCILIQFFVLINIGYGANQIFDKMTVFFQDGRQTVISLQQFREIMVRFEQKA